MASPKEIPRYTISIPEYTLNKKPNYKRVGKIIDTTLRKYFLGKTVLVRCISSADHNNKKIEELIKIITTTGSDRYDRKRKMVCHDFYAKHNPDIFASPLKITEDIEFMHEVVGDFYEGAKEDRGYPVRVDIIILYDPQKLKMIKKVYGNQEESDCFTFKDSKNKTKALLGVIRVL